MAMFLAYTSDADQVEYTENTVAATLVEKSVTSNGTYNAASDNADGYSKVTVNVSQTEPVLITKNITSNGSYSASSDSADGYSNVNVNVSGGTVSPKTITENGTYHASSENLDGYSTVTVSVPQSSGGSILIHKEISANGTYQASSDNADGFSSVTVLVSGGQGDPSIEIVDSGTARTLGDVTIGASTYYGVEIDISSYLDLYGSDIDENNFVVDINNLHTYYISDRSFGTASSDDFTGAFETMKVVRRTQKTLLIGYASNPLASFASSNINTVYKLASGQVKTTILFIPPTNS